MDGTVYCVSAINGLLLWIWKSPKKNRDPLFETDIFIIANNIFFVDASGHFHCIDALLGTEKWDIRNINASGLIVGKSKSELMIATNKNKILTISTKLGKIVDDVDLSDYAKNEIITDFLLLNDKFITGFSSGKVYETKSKRKPKLIFESSSAPIISLNYIDGNCLVTDYNGNLTLININVSK
jgi:hypothetical protein